MRGNAAVANGVACELKPSAAIASGDCTANGLPATLTDANSNVTAYDGVDRLATVN